MELLDQVGATLTVLQHPISISSTWRCSSPNTLITAMKIIVERFQIYGWKCDTLLMASFAPCRVGKFMRLRSAQEEEVEATPRQ